jgi:hypothetical protein
MPLRRNIMRATAFVFVFVLAGSSGIAFEATAQMRFDSRESSLFAQYSRDSESDSRTDRYTGFDRYSNSISLGGGFANASQTSELWSDRISVVGVAGGGGGGGNGTSDAETRFEVLFTLLRAAAFEAQGRFEYSRGSGIAGASLFRDGQSQSIFQSDSTLNASGVLDAGTYRLFFIGGGGTSGFGQGQLVLTVIPTRA